MRAPRREHQTLTKTLGAEPRHSNHKTTPRFVLTVIQDPRKHCLVYFIFKREIEYADLV